MRQAPEPAPDVDWDSHLRQALQQRAEAALYRHRRTLDSAQGVHIVVDGQPCLNFSSNDYLGLASHPEVVAAAVEAAGRYGLGSGASHLVCGHGREHDALEQELAAFTGRERALLFSTGYMANQGVIGALVGKGDQLLQDRLNHASLLDAGLLCGARMQRFGHNDTAQLGRRLAALPAAARTLIAVEGVYSMDGDCAPLAAMADLARERGALLMVDDAHGFGVLGERGAGATEHWSLSQAQVPVLMGTLGKALGTFGAFVAGSDALIETLIQRSRSYIYTTALPPAVAAASRAALRLVAAEPWRRAQLQALQRRLRSGLERLPWPLLPSATPIQPVLVGSAEAALALSAGLQRQGIYVPAIRPPTVPAGGARLRITLSAAHSERDVDRLLAALAGLCP